MKPVRPLDGSVYVEVGPAKIKGDNAPITYIALIGFFAIVLFWIYAKYIHRHAVRHVQRAVQKRRVRKARGR